MKFHNKIIIFIYYFSIIILTIILLSFVFGIVTKRLFLESNAHTNTKYYYLELVIVWLILIMLSAHIKYNFSQYSRKTINIYMEKNDHDYLNNDDLTNQINALVKFDLTIIVGFLIVFINSHQHTHKEKLNLLNEDIGLFSDLFI